MSLLTRRVMTELPSSYLCNEKTYYRPVTQQELGHTGHELRTYKMFVCTKFLLYKIVRTSNVRGTSLFEVDGGHMYIQIMSEETFGSGVRETSDMDVLWTSD